jgi:DNA-binding NtrC family response regulator
MKFQKRLLFVDDERGIRETLPAILRRYGFTVTFAATVSEAVQQMRTHEFDILLCDLNIRGEGDGFEVIGEMQKINPHCVTMVLTGHPAVESAIRGICLGIDDYLIKPANADMLVALLAEKLAAKSGERQSSAARNNISKRAA